MSDSFVIVPDRIHNGRNAVDALQHFPAPKQLLGADAGSSYWLGSYPFDVALSGARGPAVAGACGCRDETCGCDSLPVEAAWLANLVHDEERKRQLGSLLIQAGDVLSEYIRTQSKDPTHSVVRELLEQLDRITGGPRNPGQAFFAPAEGLENFQGGRMKIWCRQRFPTCPDGPACPKDRGYFCFPILRVVLNWRGVNVSGVCDCLHWTRILAMMAILLAALWLVGPATAAAIRAAVAGAEAAAAAAAAGAVRP